MKSLDFSDAEINLYNLVDENITKCLRYINKWFAEKHIKAVLGNIQFDVDEQKRTFSLSYNGLEYRDIAYPHVVISEESKVLYRTFNKDIEFFRENRQVLEVCILEGKFEEVINSININDKTVQAHLETVLNRVRRLVIKYLSVNKVDVSRRPKNVGNLCVIIYKLETSIEYLEELKEKDAEEIGTSKITVENAIKTLKFILKWFLYIKNCEIEIVPEARFVAPEEDGIIGYSPEQAYAKSVIVMYKKAILEEAPNRYGSNQVETEFALKLGCELFQSIHYLLCKCNWQKDIDKWNLPDDTVRTVIESAAGIFEQDWCREVYGRYNNIKVSDDLAKLYAKSKYAQRIYPAYPFAGTINFIDSSGKVCYIKLAEFLEESLYSWKNAFEYLDKASTTPAQAQNKTYTWFRKIRALKYECKHISLHNMKGLPVKTLEFDILDTSKMSYELVFYNRSNGASQKVTSQRLIYKTLASIKRSLVLASRNKTLNDLPKTCVNNIKDLSTFLDNDLNLLIDTNCLAPMDRIFLRELTKQICQK